MDAVNVVEYLSLVGLETSLLKCSLNIAQYESDLVRKESIFGLRQVVSRDSVNSGQPAAHRHFSLHFVLLTR